MDPLFEAKVKQAFSKVKEDITSLKLELNEYKALIRDLIEKISSLLEKKQENTLDDKNISIGNKGAYAFSHSVIQSPFTHLNTHSLTKSDKLPDQTLTFPIPYTQDTNLNKLDSPLQTLTNKEFLVFLTIYQLEKELPRVTYEELAKRLALTSGCIRSYITSLIRKKTPIIKSKLNNKLIILSIDKSFRSLISEQKLIDLYYQNDPYQSTLS